MTTARDKIAEIIDETLQEDSGHIFGFDEAADAILAALPDMIAPLFWVQSNDMPWRKAAQGYNIKYVIVDWNIRDNYGDGTDKSGFWFLGPDGYVDCLFEQYAVDLANTHHRAAIMDAFNAPTEPNK
jgi:hypothetical protein